MGDRLAGIAHPSIYEINTWPWLTELSARQRRPVDLGGVPDDEWDAIAALGFDAVWLMGVWERSPAGVAIGLADENVVAGYRRALPDYRTQDVVGSPYAVRRYVVDAHLGGPDGLAAARRALADRGVGLVLDFVPNHVATDHPWTRTHPDYFVAGTADDLRDDPWSFHPVDGRVLANGRDPYFPAWTDVVQLNAFAPGLREATAATLRDIAAQCDGVRCDMAMLMMNDIFARTWGGRVGDPPDDDFWPTVIPAVRQAEPGFVFIAEAYWDLEWALQQQGFDFCYDKRLYDRLVHEDAEQVRLHLCAEHSYQRGLLRFVENHDEPRAAATFGRERQQAATVTALTQTGARLVHQGQITGRRVHVPVQLGRLPAEQPDADVEAFHRSLLDALDDPTFRTGRWRLCDRYGWPGDDGWWQLLAWCWEGPTRWLVVVNLGDGAATGRVTVPFDDLDGSTWRLTDPVQGDEFIRDGAELRQGLHVALPAWGWHVLRIEPMAP